MFDYYVQKYQNKGLLIDANLLLMLFTGSIVEDVSQFKRTKKYQTSDYQLLLAFADKFDEIITTPNILTEVSNLAGSNNMHKETHIQFFQKFAKHLTVLSEEYIQSQSISEELICKYGLTDAGIINLVKDKYLFLTDDLPLYGFATGQKIDTINFNHLRII